MSEEANMNIPDGLSCGDCRLFLRCNALIGMDAGSTECDFFPVKFVFDTKKYFDVIEDLKKEENAYAMSRNRESEALKMISQLRGALRSLLQAIDASTYGEDGLHHHTCPAPEHGKCSCGAYEAVDQARALDRL